MRNLLFPIVILCLLSGILSAQDTIVVQTLTFDSITTRRGIWNFPTENNFRKILMVHTLKCDGQTQHDQYQCGEWDYLTYNKVYVHTGTYDSTLYYHPNFTFANDRTADSVLMSDDPAYNYFRHMHSSVEYEDTISYENIEIGWWEEWTNSVLPAPNHSGRSQYLWLATELSDQGFTEGLITGIKLFSDMLAEDLSHVMIRTKLTDSDELTPDNLTSQLDTVFYNNVNFNGNINIDFNFIEPFFWDGISNIILDFSFTDYNVTGEVLLWGSDPGFNCGISSGSNNYALDLDGETDFLKLPEDTYFNSDFTFEAWIYKRNNNKWSRVFDFGNGPNQNNVIIALSNNTSGKLSFHINNDLSNKSFILEDATPLNEWTHITLRLTAHLAWVYINGEFVKLGLLQQPNDTERSINYIGRSNWANDDFANMLIDEYRLYKITLEPEEIKAQYRQELESPEADTNLIVYFSFNEVDGNILDQSAYGHHPESLGLPDRYAITGPEIFLGFHQSNIRPWIQFERLESSNINIDYLQVIDSIADSPTQLVLFENLDDPTIPTDTILVWQAGTRYVYENWKVIDSVWIEPDQILNKEELPYYGEPFEVLEEFEIGRFITPYGINLDLGPQGFTWVFDVTDYAHLLQGEVDLKAGNQQELIDLKFEFIEGTPPRDVLQVDRIWDRYRSYSYKNLDDDISLPAITIPLLPEADEFKVKTRLTGHGHNSNTGEYPHCCEWKDNEHYLMVNGDTITDWHIFQYHDCGLNPVYPQGGTWPGAREGWCPGDLVTDHDFEITQYIIGNEVTLDYDITPVPPDNLGMGNGNYVIAMHLVQYNESNFATDAEIYDIVTPGNKDYYSRKNPVCYDPEIIIRNNGTSPLTALDFEYGVSGGIPQNYTWIGHIDPHYKDTIILPVTFSSFWLGDTLSQFNVSISNPNSQMDEYADNNSFQTSFNLPDMYDQPFFFQLKTNNQAYRYHMQIRDVLGNVIIDLDNLENNTIYRDTIDFTDGCYTLELIDDEDMGLSYWAYPAQGSGYLRFFNMDSVMIKYFNPDFGRSIFYTFNVGDVSYIQEPNLGKLVNIYPNPFSDNFTIEFDELSGFADIKVYNAQGQQVFNKRVDADSEK
ncbi:MAG: T9SS type A sorting domain-containing protein, partial [Bacteroidales bacterium]|nr:T9SS type A sorting domain-containing protein [Bacteroidales bacterium]